MNYWNEEEIKNKVFNEFESLFKNKKSLKKNLIDFHTRNKYLYFCYDQEIKDILGRVVANNNKDIEATYNDYYISLKLLFEKKASSKKILNSVLHMYGYFKKDLSSEEKKEFFKTIEIDIVQSIKMISKFADNYKNNYIMNQTILKLIK